jgi:hypothetical protein
MFPSYKGNIKPFLLDKVKCVYFVYQAHASKSLSISLYERERLDDIHLTSSPLESGGLRGIF